MNFNWLTLDAAATTSTTQQASGGLGLLGMAFPLILMFGAMYLFIIRPQKKREKAERAMRDNLQVGDEIVTIGGIHGRVISLKPETMVIESKSDHSKLTFDRSALQKNLTIHDDVASK